MLAFCQRYPFLIFLALEVSIILLWTKAPKPDYIIPQSGQVQQFLVSRYETFGIDGAELGTLASLTLGDRAAIDKDIKKAFSASGAMHILAVSGLHTGIVWAVLWMLLTCFGRKRPLYDERVKQFALAGLIILFLWFYAGVTGWSPSVVRSVLMVMIAQGALLAHRSPMSVNAVAAAAFCILLVRPMDIYSLSFQLSFAAVTAIVLFVPFFNKFVPLSHQLPSIVYMSLVYVRDLISVSLAAQIGTAPITLLYFGKFSTYFLLTNILVVPMAFLIMSGAILFFTVGWIPIIGKGIAIVLDGLAWFLNHYVSWIQSLPYAAIEFPITKMMCWVMISGIVCGAMALRDSRWALLWLIPAIGCCVGLVVLA